MPKDTEKRRPLYMRQPYPISHDYLRSGLDRHHDEIGVLQVELAELREMLRRLQLGTD